MDTFSIVKEQTIVARGKIADLARAHGADADRIPAGWNNNVRWHVGHLVVTPRRLTALLLGEELGLPAEYSKWFAKGTSPSDWGDDAVPPLEQLLGELSSETERVFADMEPRLAEAFPRSYGTTLGTVLKTPADGLTMSFIHDGIHVGLLLALARALKS